MTPIVSATIFDQAPAARIILSQCICKLMQTLSISNCDFHSNLNQYLLHLYKLPIKCMTYISVFWFDGFYPLVSVSVLINHYFIYREIFNYCCTILFGTSCISICQACKVCRSICYSSKFEYFEHFNNWLWKHIVWFWEEWFYQ